mmetsp:Transcript_20735/g.49239  ORF Transcript_20735/g.49239 Transcript_20735/m.49239 type:complete len:81 (+) Transcript_20735:1330-1572(+)
MPNSNAFLAPERFTMYVAPNNADAVYVKYNIPLCHAPTDPNRADANPKQDTTQPWLAENKIAIEMKLIIVRRAACLRLLS